MTYKERASLDAKEIENLNVPSIDKTTTQIPKSANLIEDAENLTNLLHADFMRARENPNIKLHILQSIKDKYFLIRSIVMKLHEWQFYSNENFEVFNIITDAVKRCENAPEITKLNFCISLDPTRKSVIVELYENYQNKERSEQ